MSLVCSCGAPVKPGFKFCNVCGAQISPNNMEKDETKPYSPLMDYQGRVIRMINGNKAGAFFPVYPNCTIGRSETTVEIPDDMTLSPLHARITARPDTMVIEDLNSLNGVFVRIRDKILLQGNDIIRAGDHYFLYEFFRPDHFTEGYGTEFYATPCRGEHFRIVEILSGGRRGRACMSPDGGVVVGRTTGDFTFPEDEFMSERHFTIRWTQRGGVLVDTSLNGTYLQIRDSFNLREGDLFFAGNTLFRVL
ncbi:MAG: FHA domain-containing protein [Proteobacteria bacterium]|nr:FHA domain-containing protein [Pseudomonadota bacterium]